MLGKFSKNLKKKFSTGPTKIEVVFRTMRGSAIVRYEMGAFNPTEQECVDFAEAAAVREGNKGFIADSYEIVPADVSGNARSVIHVFDSGEV